jgi:cell division protein FtsA
MAKSPLITGLDIGTSTVKILVAVKKPQSSDLEVLYAGQRPSFGVRRGVIVDAEEVSRCVKNVVKDAELGVGQEIDSFYVNIGGSHIFCAMSHGLVSVSRADQKISEEDINRVLLAAQTISLSSNKEIIDVYPREFIVDGEGGVKDATGMQGVRLEVEVLLVAGFSPYLRNLDQAVLKSDYKIMHRLPSVIADAKSVLSAQQKELGVAILDIGAGTSSLAVYEEGDLIHLAVLPIGSSNITNDIAIGLKTDVEVAEKIKIEKGTCSSKAGTKKLKADAEKEDGPVFSQKILSKIVQDRVLEIFDLVNKELKKIGRDKKLPSGIILCGGGSKLPKIEELAKKEFKLTAKIGVPRGFANIEGDPAFATVCGLALEGAELEEYGQKGEESGSFVKGAGGAIVKFIKNLIP